MTEPIEPLEPSDETDGDDAPSAADPSQRQLVLVKHGQRYIFRYRCGEESRFIASLIELVRDPDSNLDWFDAAVLSHQLGQGMSQQMQQMLKHSA